MRNSILAAFILLLALPACSSSPEVGSGSSTPTAATTSSAGGPVKFRRTYESWMTPTATGPQIQQNLQEHGYRNISAPRPMGDHWVGEAVNGAGQPVQFDGGPDGAIVIMIE